jgi:uncharacterized Zn-finger protein
MITQSHSAAPGAYRFFAVNAFDEVLSLRELECADDVEATAIAESLTSAGAGVEVWDIGRRVIKLSGDHGTAGEEMTAALSPGRDRPGQARAAMARWENEGGAIVPGTPATMRSPRSAVVGMYVNDIGVLRIAIGGHRLECIGATPPHDHPRIFLEMGEDASVRCPYCATLFVYDRSLEGRETFPAQCFYRDTQP